MEHPKIVWEEWRKLSISCKTRDYEVSNLGMVRSISKKDTTNIKYVIPFFHNDGSKKKKGKGNGERLWVKIDGTRRKLYHLIWEAFNGDIPKGMVLDHIDGIGTNDKLWNLQLLPSIVNAGKQDKSGFTH